jgi:hypothetical protein
MTFKIETNVLRETRDESSLAERFDLDLFDLTGALERSFKTRLERDGSLESDFSTFNDVSGAMGSRFLQLVPRAIEELRSSLVYEVCRDRESSYLVVQGQRPVCYFGHRLDEAYSLGA